MPVKYNVVERKNPLDIKAPSKFYASAKADGEINLKAIAREISGGSTTVSDTDVLAVLNDLVKCMGRHLANGEVVKLGDFGNFQVTIASEGSETAEKVTSANIIKQKITFRPGVDLRDILKTLKFEKYGK